MHKSKMRPVNKLEYIWICVRCDLKPIKKEGDSNSKGDGKEGRKHEGRGSEAAYQDRQNDQPGRKEEVTSKPQKQKRSPFVGDLCSSCGMASMIYEEGCMNCKNPLCGYSKC